MTRPQFTIATIMCLLLVSACSRPVKSGDARVSLEAAKSAIAITFQFKQNVVSEVDKAALDLIISRAIEDVEAMADHDGTLSEAAQWIVISNATLAWIQHRENRP